MLDEAAYNELSYYTLAHKDPAFIHQYVVDTYAAQHADERSKPISIAFALAGLYLHNEKHFTGKQVQSMHMKLAGKRTHLPTIVLPADRGHITVHDVIMVAPGPRRDEAIEQWSASVWAAYRSSQHQVACWIKHELGIGS